MADFEDKDKKQESQLGKKTRRPSKVLSPHTYVAYHKYKIGHNLETGINLTAISVEL